jgi:hypothetical protein
MTAKHSMSGDRQSHESPLGLAAFRPVYLLPQSPDKRQDLPDLILAIDRFP